VALPPSVESSPFKFRWLSTSWGAPRTGSDEQCASAVEAIRARYPEVVACAIGYADGLEIASDTILRRARHVVSEDERVREIRRCLPCWRLGQTGELFVESHRSLQFDYEVTARSSISGLGGDVDRRRVRRSHDWRRFGGCTVNLVDPAASASLNARSPVNTSRDTRFARRCIAAVPRPGLGNRLTPDTQVAVSRNCAPQVLSPGAEAAMTASSQFVYITRRDDQLVRNVFRTTLTRKDISCSMRQTGHMRSKYLADMTA